MHNLAFFKVVIEERAAGFAREAERSRLARQVPRQQRRGWLFGLGRRRASVDDVTRRDAEPNGLGSGLRPRPDAQLAEDA